MLQTPDTAIVQTLLAGGIDGTQFDDFVALGWPGINPLNMGRPIVKIEVHHGLAVDALNVTYLLKDGKTIEIEHGSQKSSTITRIDVDVDEVILDVCGKAGYHSFYQRVVVCQISFVILNKQTAGIRVVGPLGNGDGSNQGVVYQDSGTAAFAGWETNKPEAALAGLSFWTSKSWE